MKRVIDKLIIHCAATPNGKPFTAHDIDNWHRERGFNRKGYDIARFNPTLRYIGYHNVIPLHGTILNGRGWDEIGAHCAGQNAHSIGVCLIGTDQFTAAQWNTLRSFVRYFRSEYPDGTIHGHREFANKICPGFDVQTWLRSGMSTPGWHLLGDKK